MSLQEASARLWNKANYQRRQAFFKQTQGPSYQFQCKQFKEDPDFRQLGTCKGQALLQKLSEAWKAAFKLLKLQKLGKLPHNIEKVGIPHYWKNRKTNSLEPRGIYVRNDGYWIEKQTLSIGKKLKIRYTSGAMRSGKQGRLEIQRMAGRWYAHEPVETVEPKNPHVLSELRTSASIDLGVCNLLTAVINNEPVVYSGRSVLSDWRYRTKRIAKLQSQLYRINSRHTSKRLQSFFSRRRQHLEHALNAMLRDLFHRLCEAGIERVAVGDLTGIKENVPSYNPNANQKIHNFWPFRKIVSRMEEVAEECQIQLALVPELYTSQRCSLCENHPIHHGARIKRGLYYCPVQRKYINADVNGALNIAGASVSKKGETTSGSGLLAEPILLKWDGCRWESKSSMTTKEDMNTIEVQTTKIPVLISQ